MKRKSAKVSVPLIFGGLVLVVIASAAGLSFALNKPEENSIENNCGNENNKQNNTENNSSENSNFEDGSYNAMGRYTSPGGEECVNVELTLDNNIITDITVEPQASNPTSRSYQNKFIAGISDVVVGKPIDSNFDLTSVNGSSLTPIGFKEALETIINDARV